jgi:hypothetical protein
MRHDLRLHADIVSFRRQQESRLSDDILSVEPRFLDPLGMTHLAPANYL